MPVDDGPLKAGVIGVGKMGNNHARTYRTLPEAELVGVFDADQARAEAVAEKHDTSVVSVGEMLETVDVASVAVPTPYHYETARECIDAGVDVLIEKPFVKHPENGRRLIEFADERDVTLQVGHIERFNPAVIELLSLVEQVEPIAITARRLGPPIDRDIEETAVVDLMIHDVDVLLALIDTPVEHVDAVGTDDGEYAAANLSFDCGVVGQLTASRVTQEKVRKLTISAESCRITMDYIEQVIEVRRDSIPEYVRSDGDVHHRHANVVEKLAVEDREPLKNQLSSFIEAVRTGSEPVVSGEDGLRALELTQVIDDLIAGDREGSITDPADSVATVRD